MTLSNVGHELVQTGNGTLLSSTVGDFLNAHALDNELLKLSLSPIAPWVDDPEVTDILVYGSQDVYVRRRGGSFEAVKASWFSDADLMTAAKTIGRQMARRLDSREPILDARLPDKSRVKVPELPANLNAIGPKLFCVSSVEKARLPCKFGWSENGRISPILPITQHCDWRQLHFPTNDNYTSLVPR